MTVEFRKAMEAVGIRTRDSLIADGKLHRFHIDGDKSGTKDGWYVLYDDGVPAGVFGDWKENTPHKWSAKNYRQLTPAERREYLRRQEAVKIARNAEQARIYAEARDKAAYIWDNSLPAPADHPYLLDREVKSHGLRLYKGALVIPLYDCAGTLHSLQFIDEDCNKRFLSGGRKKACHFFIEGEDESLCIAEGYATAASVHALTGYPVITAFDAGNLLPVSKAMREKFPTRDIILCADNDIDKPQNIGLIKGTEAAQAIGARLAYPYQGGDFNDLYREKTK